MRRVLASVAHGTPEVRPPNEQHTKFDYLFDDIVSDPTKHLPASANTVAALKKLGSTMVEPANSDLNSNSPIPPIYTYWGQFVDHDSTANTDRDGVTSNITKDPLVPLHPDVVRKNLENLREPSLNLDSLYGDGPHAKQTGDDEFVPYEGIKLKLGEAVVADGIPGDRIPPVNDLARDLPRKHDTNDPKNIGVAMIGDARNDENLVVAQIHVAFIRFHNAAVDWIKKKSPEKKDDEVFELAKSLTQWSYQWVVVHDFLKTVAIPSIVDKVLENKGDGLLRLGYRGTYMPLEFSVAAYRFGHSMVRPEYDWNRNFGRPGKVIGNAPFDLLFQFTGKPSAGDRFKGQPRLPFNWIAEWDRMVDKKSQFPDRFARRIDTQIAPPLGVLRNEGNDDKTSPDIRALLKQLAERNLLRGYLLSLPTGQAVAEKLGVKPLTADEMTEGSSAPRIQALKEGGFIERTPLWFYVLRESEVRAGGKSLGEIGSRIVAETIIGHIRNDSSSYLNQKGWDPSKGVLLKNGRPVESIPDFLRFAGVLA